jgi:hypothetical protein
MSDVRGVDAVHRGAQGWGRAESRSRPAFNLGNDVVDRRMPSPICRHAMAGIWLGQGIVGDFGRAAVAAPICQEVFDVEVIQDGAMPLRSNNPNGCIVLLQRCPFVAKVCQQVLVSVYAS